MYLDYLYEERVAIMIIEGGLSESEAKDKAWHCCYRKTTMIHKPDGGVEFRHTLSANKPPAKEVAKQEEQQTEMSFEEFRSQARNRFNYE